VSSELWFLWCSAIFTAICVAAVLWLRHEIDEYRRFTEQALAEARKAQADIDRHHRNHGTRREQEGANGD
jgi:hypothetical protein